MSSQLPRPLGDLLSPSTVRAHVRADSWPDAVGSCGALLVDSGCCEPRYVEAMVDAVRELGPYIVIAPGVAMPHARPEQGVTRQGVAVITLEKPVEFGNRANDPVDVVIAFAAEDKEAHLATLQSIAALLIDGQTLGEVRMANDDAELEAALGLHT